MKYTPGPWKWGHIKGNERTDGSDWGANGLWTMDNKLILGDGPGWDGGFQEPKRVADQHLIVAAPDMYEALDKVCLVVCKKGMDCGDCNLNFIEKVLQKARG